MDGKCLATVNEFPHLGHIITSNLNDESDIVGLQPLSSYN